MSMGSDSIRILSTCPPSNRRDAATYLDEVRAIARMSEAAGHVGILVYTDNGLVDAWLLSAEIVRATERLSPLVAVQPVYMHPYTVAKMVTSFATFYGRRLWLNFVAGGFKNDLLALDDRTPHDDRYVRLGEYIGIISALLRNETVTFEGRYYRVENLRLTPQLDPALFPELLISGSSAEGLAVAQAANAVAVQYPQPPAQYAELAVPDGVRTGIRVGIIARESGEEAWSIAHERFPPDRRGQMTHQLAMKTSDSAWHRQLSETAASAREREGGIEPDPYWLVPFENYKTFCPYLVGTHERVAEEIGRYLRAGARTIILDVPVDGGDLRETGRAIELAIAAQAAS